MKIQGVVFDLGNTLMYLDADPEEVINQGVAEMIAFFKHKRVRLDEVRLGEAFLAERRAGRELVYQTDREVPCGESLRAALDKVQAPPEAYKLIGEAVRAYFRPEEAAWKAYPDARTVLKQLSRQGSRLGLLSNATDDAFVQRLVNRLEFRPWLSPVFSSAGLGFRKPVRDVFDLILSRWNLSPGATAMVGDTLDTDILGAQNAGMRSILITADEAPGNDAYRERIIPNASIARLQELPELLDVWQSGGNV
jgi:HAD superfamily hydrolase (TIGR01549 family)